MLLLFVINELSGSSDLNNEEVFHSAVTISNSGMNSAASSYTQFSNRVCTKFCLAIKMKELFSDPLTFKFKLRHLMKKLLQMSTICFTIHNILLV